MACHNKFENELNLELIDHEPTTLIVGIFEPGAPVNNPAPWFYGRTDSSYFWDVLPRLYGEASLINASPTEWRQFCRDKQIAITNIISSIDDVDADNKEHVKILSGYSEEAIAYHFDDINFVNVTRLLQQRPSIRNVYITRGITEAYWRHLWNPVMLYCNRNNIHERKLLTPGSNVAYQQEAYNTEHPDAPLLLQEDYILMRWKEEWHF